MSNHPITTEQLAGIVQQGFSSMEQFNDKRFTSIEGDLAAIRRQLHTSVYQMEFMQLEKRVSILEQKTGSR